MGTPRPLCLPVKKLLTKEVLFEVPQNIFPDSLVALFEGRDSVF